jgi:hypothetical protein
VFGWLFSEHYYQLLKVKPIVALVAVKRKMLILINEENYDGHSEQKKSSKKQIPCCTG